LLQVHAFILEGRRNVRPLIASRQTIASAALSNYEKFGWLREQLAKDGCQITLASGNWRLKRYRSPREPVPLCF
jgi:hypothetical protein